MTIESIIKQAILNALKSLYGADIKEKSVQIQKTKKEFKGNFTVVVFPFLAVSKKKPEYTATDLGNFLLQNINEIEAFNVIKGFLNLEIKNQYWIDFLSSISIDNQFYNKEIKEDSKIVMIEFSSPNTNKPLHLGHIRNNLLGDSIAKIIKADGNKVIKVNLINDRGIHICKSMLAWQKWGNNLTPKDKGLKGDHFVGDYYVLFDKEYKKEIQALVDKGISEDDAKKQASLINEAQDMLRKWEAGDKQVCDLWKTMNAWVYDGFDQTYNALGISFDKIYYESQTYMLGKEIVIQGSQNKQLTEKKDNSIWADLTSNGLDEKLLLRADGTSVYMTQDIGTAHQRFTEFNINEHIYVVGNEQNYHFQVLKLVLKKLGFEWADKINHFAYGMVELPEGKMKSREGTVVDADDLIAEMITTSRDISNELGKLDGYTDKEAQQTYTTIALGALKYFILKVDPKKNMVFDPKESIDFTGNTGPFIQYTYARIQSILRKAKEQNILVLPTVSSSISLNEKEVNLIQLIHEYTETLHSAATECSPALIANYIYELVKEFNQFYHECSILSESDNELKLFRLLLAEQTAKVIKTTMQLLGIDVPERM